MVNSNFAVYSKTGTVLRTSTPINQLWAGTNSECATHNDGDPVIVYDQLANRWLLSQFIATPQTGEQYGECVAISTTSDATGAYYRYTFLFGSVAPQTFFDYPKFGVCLAASTSVSYPAISMARRCRRPASRPCSRRSTIRARSRRPRPTWAST
jgi:hypothetical protein